MIGTMVELDIGQPRVAILVLCNRGIIFLLGRVGKAVGGRYPIDVNPLSQTVNALTVREIRSPEFEISLRGGEGELAALGHSLRRQNKSIGDNGRAAAAGRADKTIIGTGGEMEQLSVDIIAGTELPLVSRNLTDSFSGEGPIPSGWCSIRYAKQHTIGDRALCMQGKAKSEITK